MDDLKVFFQKYGGAIIGLMIGILLAILILCTNLYKFIIGVAIVVGCVYVGNYFQRNKETVKEKIKKTIDRL